MKHWFEVHFSVHGVSGSIGERLLANSSSDAINAVLARYPGATVHLVRQLD
jgi:hypothetical protein